MLSRIQHQSAEKHNLAGLDALFNRKQYTKAISSFSRAIFSNAEEPSYYWHRAEAYLQISDFESCILNLRLFQELLDKRFSIVVYTWAQILLDQKRYKESLVFFKQTLSMGSFTHADIGARLAIANIDLGNIDEALSHLFQLTNTEAIVTHDIEIYLLRSRLYIIQDKIFYAAADLKIALQINPKHPGIHSLACKVMAAANQFKNKASEQIIRNDLNLAIWYLNQAIELDPEDYKTLMLRGIILGRLSKDQEGLEDLLEVYTWPTRDGDCEEELCLELAKLHEKIAVDMCELNKDYEKALERFQLSLNFYPNNPRLYRNRAACYLDMNNDEEALKDLFAIVSSKFDAKKLSQALSAADLEELQKDAHIKICSVYTRRAKEQLEIAMNLPLADAANPNRQACYQKATAFLTSALEYAQLDSMRLPILFERSRCYFYQQSLESMKSDLMACLDIDPAHVLSRAMLSLYDKPSSMQPFPLPQPHRTLLSSNFESKEGKGFRSDLSDNGLQLQGNNVKLQSLDERPQMSTKKRNYSIIVWGATGFTGKLVAEYLAKSAPKEITFAIAGRSQLKLDSIYKHLQQLNPLCKIGVIIADSHDEKSLGDMVKQAHVIITTVGPYIKYGMPLVASCVRNCTDYVDITGESAYIKESIEKYHDEAAKKGVSIIHSCGFDSIPSDLGTFLLADYFKAKGLVLDNARLSVRGMSGVVSGGTVASVIETAGNSSFKELKEMSNPNLLIDKPKGKAWGSTVLYYDKGLKSYQTPFFMEACNAKLVRRTNFLLEYNSIDFQYCEGVQASNIFVAIALTFVNALLGLVLIFPPPRWMIGKIMPPGTGPSEYTRKNGFFKIDIIGEAKTIEGKTVSAKVSIKGEGDPGYDATSRMIAESAIALVLDKKKRSGGETGNFKLLQGGVITPASALGMLLVKRLNKTGIVFSLQA